MPLTANRVQGDVRDWVLVAVDGVESVEDVTDAEAHVWRGATRVTLDAAVVDVAGKVVRVELGDTVDAPWLPDVEMRHPVDEWKLEVQLTWADGTVLTFPSGSPLVVLVRRQGDQV